MAESLIIDHVGHRGDGVAITGNQPVFVPYTLPGEQVEVESVAGHADRKRPIQITTASADRIDPFCPHFGTCGGCAIQHWQPVAYQAWKREIVVSTLAQAGLNCHVSDLVDAHGSGRRRVVVHARRGRGDVATVGFALAGSHEIAPIDHCSILAPELNGALEAARAIASALNATGKPLDIQVTTTDGGLDVDVRGSGPLPASITATLARIAAQHDLARLTRHGELVLMRQSPELRVGAARVTLPPGSFLQATQAGEEALAAHVQLICGKARVIADLFCGVGPFALRLAERAKIFAYDSESGAITALQKAAQTTKGLKPIRAETRDLFRRPLVPQELKDVDAVIFDPPRQGAQAQTRQLATSNVPLLIAVSCNVATFARDARILIDAGYKLDRVTPIDQFRHTPHVELVAAFRR